MQKWCFEELSLKGAYKIETFFASDIRGGFCKDYSKETFKQNGLEYNLSETFYTYSHKGVIRAIHFQLVHQQPKLMRCISGRVFHVLVDLRPDSKTFKQWMSFELSGDKYIEILVPAGFGNGYLVLEDNTIMSYKCSEKFYPEYDTGIMWNDSTINIKWPLNRIGGLANLILADKDKSLMTFDE